MADLTIKPTSGANLVIQYEGGYAALTVSTSGNTTLAGAANNLGSIASATNFPAGHIIQVVQTVKQDTFSMASQSETLITGYNISITPSKASSKILVNYSFDTGTSTSITAYAYMQRKIGSADWAHLAGIHGAASGGTPLPALSHGGGENAWELQKRAGMYLDSPSYTLGDAIQYRIGLRNEATSATIYVGRTSRDNTLYHPRTASILICMEVAG